MKELICIFDQCQRWKCTSRTIHLKCSCVDNSVKNIPARQHFTRTHATKCENGAPTRRSALSRGFCSLKRRCFGVLWGLKQGNVAMHTLVKFFLNKTQRKRMLSEQHNVVHAHVGIKKKGSFLESCEIVQFERLSSCISTIQIRKSGILGLPCYIRAFKDTDRLPVLKAEVKTLGSAAFLVSDPAWMLFHMLLT